MRIGWVVATVVLLAGCAGSDSDGSSEGDLPEAPKTSVKPLPDADPGTKAEAQKILDGAFDQFIEDGTGSFRSTVKLLGVSLRQEGEVDVAATAGAYETLIPDPEGTGEELSIEFRAIDTRVYMRPTSGPMEKCWFDYGDSSPLFAGNETPWLHVAFAAITEARAVGLIDGRDDLLVVEAPAAQLLSITSSKLANMVASQVTEEPVWAAAVVVLDEEGRYRSMRFNLDDVLAALDESGIDVLDALVSSVAEEIGSGRPEGDVETVLKKYFSTTQRVTYEQGVAVNVEVPAADELMDASNITQKGQKDPDLCRAAG